jgi:hypothetical protein
MTSLTLEMCHHVETLRQEAVIQCQNAKHDIVRAATSSDVEVTYIYICCGTNTYFVIMDNNQALYGINDKYKKPLGRQLCRF